MADKIGQNEELVGWALMAGISSLIENKRRILCLNKDVILRLLFLAYILSIFVLFFVAVRKPFVPSVEYKSILLFFAFPLHIISIIYLIFIKKVAGSTHTVWGHISSSAEKKLKKHLELVVLITSSFIASALLTLSLSRIPVIFTGCDAKNIQTEIFWLFKYRRKGKTLNDLYSLEFVSDPEKTIKVIEFNWLVKSFKDPEVKAKYAIYSSINYFGRRVCDLRKLN